MSPGISLAQGGDERTGMFSLYGIPHPAKLAPHHANQALEHWNHLTKDSCIPTKVPLLYYQSIGGQRPPVP